VRFEEFRHALGEMVGEPDLQTPVPVRILVFRNAKGWASPAPLAEGRDCYAIVLAEKGAVPPAVYSELTRLFLKSNTAQMPPAFEHGLAEFFTTFEVSGIHITVGAPRPAPARPRLGARASAGGGPRILRQAARAALQPAQGRRPGPRPTAMRSASRRPKSRRRPSAISPNGNFQTTSLSSRPMTERDFPEKPISDADARLARADLLAGSQSAAEYQSLIRDGVKVAEAEEGLGLLALAGHRTDEARRHFAASMEAGSASARCYIEYAKLEPDDAKAMQALLRAAGINPKLDEPFALMARRDTDPQKRLAHWKAAAERNPRDPSYWQALAECYLADHNYAEAAKAWKEGEQAATDPAQRERMRQARMAIEQQRLDYEEAERKRRAEEEARAIES
jgi:tetratricopeptide (TPR) repeat protein